MVESSHNNNHLPVQLEIEHVYGYRTADCQQNL